MTYKNNILLILCHHHLAAHDNHISPCQDLNKCAPTVKRITAKIVQWSLGRRLARLVACDPCAEAPLSCPVSFHTLQLYYQ